MSPATIIEQVWAATRTGQVMADIDQRNGPLVWTRRRDLLPGVRITDGDLITAVWGAQSWIGRVIASEPDSDDLWLKPVTDPTTRVELSASERPPAAPDEPTAPAPRAHSDDGEFAASISDLRAGLVTLLDADTRWRDLSRQALGAIATLLQAKADPSGPQAATAVFTELMSLDEVAALCRRSRWAPAVDAAGYPHSVTRTAEHGNDPDDRLALARLALGTRVRELRSRAGLTAKTLSEDTGITASYLSDIERGRTLPTLPVLLALADHLRVLVSDLLADIYPFDTHDRPRTPPSPPPDGRRQASGHG